MKNILSSLENAVPHILYDLSLPLPERKDKAVVYRTSREVALFLGINYSKVSYYRVPGRRVKGKDGKEYAIRIAKKDLADISK
jgi:hypothetical protein